MPTPPEYREIARLVGADVRAELARRGKTNADLATMLGLTSPTISKRLSGEIPFDVVELAKISDWLDVDVSVFGALSVTPKAVTA